MRTFATYHHKGGVGKTTTAVALSAHAAANGYRTLLWDLDPQGAATRLVGADRGLEGGVESWLASPDGLLAHATATRHDNLDVVPADLSLRTLDRVLHAGGPEALEHLIGAAAHTHNRYDVLILDCQPAVSLASTGVLRTAQVVVTPLTAGPLAWSAFADLSDEVDAIGAHAPQLLAVLTMVDRRKTLHRDLADDVVDSEGFSATYIPTDSVIEKMALAADPTRAVLSGRAGHAYGRLWDELDLLTTPALASAS